MTPTARRYAYGIALAGAALAMAYGLIDGNTAPLWLALIGAILGNGLALANVTTTPNDKKDPPRHAAQGPNDADN